MDIPIIVHVSGASVGLVSGYAALWAAKGRTGHRRAGVAFVVSMVVMGVTGAGIAAVELPANPGVGLEMTTLVGLLTAYLVLSGFLAVRSSTRRETATVMGLGIAIVLTEAALALGAMTSSSGTRDGMPAAAYVVFGSVGLLGVLGDARVLRAGPPTGNRRLRRHLWRMCAALLIAALSFFLGQADNLPTWYQALPLRLLPIAVVLASMIYWLWRLRTRRASRRNAVVRTGERVTVRFRNGSIGRTAGSAPAQVIGGR